MEGMNAMATREAGFWTALPDGRWVEVEVADPQTGEISRRLLDRIVLVEPNGDAYACVSDGVRKSLQLLMHYYGAPPWKPALKVKVEQVTTRRGFRTFILNPVA